MAGHRINDGMGVYLAQPLVKLLTTHGNMPLKDLSVSLLGLTVLQEPELAIRRLEI